MPPPQQKQAAPDFIPAEPDFIPADGGHPTAPPPQPPQSLMSQAGQAAEDFGKGVLKGGMSTVANLDDAARKYLPAFMTKQWFGLGQPTDIQHEHQMAQTHNTAQAIGKGAEQVGEFFVPGGAEESVGEHLAELAPKAKPIIKMAASALGAGAVNKAQGGSFKMGAAMGGAGEGVAQGIQKVAPRMAETALRISKADRLRTDKIGEAALNDTRGVKMPTIAKSAGQKMDDLENGALSQIPEGQTMRMAPVRAAGERAMGKINGENVPAVIDAGNDMRGMLDTWHATGEPVGDEISAPEALSLRRGLGKFLPNGAWNPETTNRLAPLRNQIYGAMNEGIGESFPSIREVDPRIQRLIKVERAAGSASRNAPLMQRMAGRVAAHTGAGLASIAGGTYGYERDGLPGAIAGGAMGLAIPELLVSPEMQMLSARVAHSTIPRMAAKATSGTALQASR